MSRVRVEKRGNLHLAAYIMAHGGEFMGIEEGVFLFESDAPLEEWEVRHVSSCCRKTDKALLELKRFL